MHRDTTSCFEAFSTSLDLFCVKKESICRLPVHPIISIGSVLSLHAPAIRFTQQQHSVYIANSATLSLAKLDVKLPTLQQGLCRNVRREIRSSNGSIESGPPGARGRLRGRWGRSSRRGGRSTRKDRDDLSAGGLKLREARHDGFSYIQTSNTQKQMYIYHIYIYLPDIVFLPLLLLLLPSPMPPSYP